MGNSVMTQEEIKCVLAQKYGTALAACKRMDEKAMRELAEYDDINAYKYYSKRSSDMFLFAHGIQKAAEALGIEADQLVETIRASESACKSSKKG